MRLKTSKTELLTGVGDVKMLVGCLCDAAPPWGAGQEALLKQKRKEAYRKSERMAEIEMLFRQAILWVRLKVIRKTL